MSRNTKSDGTIYRHAGHLLAPTNADLRLLLCSLQLLPSTAIGTRAGVSWRRDDIMANSVTHSRRSTALSLLFTPFFSARLRASSAATIMGGQLKCRKPTQFHQHTRISQSCQTHHASRDTALLSLDHSLRSQQGNWPQKMTSGSRLSGQVTHAWWDCPCFSRKNPFAWSGPV